MVKINFLEISIPKSQWLFWIRYLKYFSNYAGFKGFSIKLSISQPNLRQLKKTLRETSGTSETTTRGQKVTKNPENCSFTNKVKNT